MTLEGGSPSDQVEHEGRPGAQEVERFGLRTVLALVATAVLAGPFLLLLLLLRAKSDALADVDSAVIDWAHRRAVEHHSLTRFMSTVSAVLHPWSVRLAASAVSLGGMAHRRWRVGLWGLTAVWVEGPIDNVVKSAVARVRPHLLDPVASAPGYSFPSGHSLGAMVCLGVIAASLAPVLPQAARRALWSVGGALVVLVGVSRVELGVHYPSDVLAGWLLGAAWLAASAAAFDVWRPAPPQAQVDDTLRTDPE